MWDAIALILTSQLWSIYGSVYAYQYVCMYKSICKWLFDDWQILLNNNGQIEGRIINISGQNQNKIFAKCNHYHRYVVSSLRHQTITWTIQPFETNFSDIGIKRWQFSFKEIHLKMTTASVEENSFIILSSGGVGRTLYSYTVLAWWQWDCLWGMRHDLLTSPLVDLNIVWNDLVEQWIMGSHDRWQCPPFLSNHWQSPC